MRIRSTVQLCAILLIAVLLAVTTASATAAAEPDSDEYEYDANELLSDGAVTSSAAFTLALNGTASESQTIRVEIDEDRRSAFKISDVSDATADDIGIEVDSTDSAIDIELVDLGGDRNVTGRDVSLGVELTATEAAAGSFERYDSTPIASVVKDETESDLDGKRTINVSIFGRAEIGFEADEIDEEAENGFLPSLKDDSFTISFSKESVWVDDGDTIKISVDPNTLNESDTDGLEIGEAWENGIQDANISSIDVTTSTGANVLDGNTDQIAVTINTVDGGPQLVSDEAISLNIQLAIQTESMKAAADRYRETDLFTVDVAAGNTELNDNADIETGSPVVFDIYPGEADADGFELRGIESGSTFAIEENRTLAVDELTDRFGNEIRWAAFEFVLEGNAGSESYADVRMETDGTSEIAVGNGGQIDTRLGVFDLSAEVTDVEGPATQSEHTGEAVTETIEGISIYPGDVTVETTTVHRDFDVDGASIELAVDLGVSDDSVDRVDLELRRQSGAGTVAFEPIEGGPTDTDLWEETGYAGDGHLGQENPWAIERELTATDFDDGVRTYVVDADTADRYEIAVEVMPRGDRLVPDHSEVETSLSGATDGGNRNVTEIVATGAIETVGNVSVGTDQEFVGVEIDEGGDVEIVLDDFVDAAGNVITNTDESVSVGIGETTAGDVGPTAGEPPAVASVDPTDIELSAVETGADADVTIEFEAGTQRNTTEITLVHRAIERPGGSWRAASLPQPATLHIDADGGRDVVQWNPEADAYESVGTDAADDVLKAKHVGHEHLHRGLYVYSEEGAIRMGFEYATDDDEAISAGDVTLESGWHLASSNYDTSTHAQRSLVDDVNWANYGFGSEDDAFSIWSADLSERLHDRTAGFAKDGSKEPIGHGDVYWIRVNEGENAPLSRGVISPTFSEQDGIEE